MKILIETDLIWTRSQNMYETNFGMYVFDHRNCTYQKGNMIYHYEPNVADHPHVIVTETLVWQAD